MLVSEDRALNDDKAPEPEFETYGIPIGRFPNRICWWPMPEGGYWLHDPERPDRLKEQGLA